MLKIGDFSKLSRVSIRMLRHYDEIGLLSPATTDKFTGYRYYSETQLPVMARINALKDMGFGLAAIAELLKCYDDPKVLAQHLSLKQLELEEEAKDTARRLHLLESAINRLERNNTMKYDVLTKELPERYVASVRQIIPNYNSEGMLWELLYKELAPMNVQHAEPCYSMAIFHDGEFKESGVDVEIQGSVKGSYKNTEHVVFKTEPAVLIASATYKGSYELISEVNTAVANWVNDNGYEFTGKSFNIYHVSPAQTTNPDELVTEVCYSVRKK